MDTKTKKIGLSVLVGLFFVGIIILSGCIGGECGNLGQNCCKNNTCNISYVCGSEEKCEKCGGISELCCKGNVCNEGMCVNKTCEKCGSFDELCCAGNTCNEGMCSNGTCKKISAKEDIDRAVSLTNTAKNRIDEIHKMVSVTTADIKNKLDMSKIDYEEALKILKNTKTDYDSEKKIIETNKIICEASLDVINSSQNSIVGWDHFKKGYLYMGSQDTEKSKYELKLGGICLDDALSATLKAKENINKINMDNVPSELKSNIQGVKNEIENSEKSIPDSKKAISGMYPYLDGLKHIITASDYVKNKKWHSAAVECKESLPYFSKSKDIFSGLRDSESTDVSSVSIRLYGFLETYMKVVEHMEAGCRYMDKRQEEKANEEFEKAALELQKISWQTY